MPVTHTAAPTVDRVHHSTRPPVFIASRYGGISGLRQSFDRPVSLQRHRYAALHTGILARALASPEIERPTQYSGAGQDVTGVGNEGGRAKRVESGGWAWRLFLAAGIEGLTKTLAQQCTATFDASKQYCLKARGTRSAIFACRAAIFACRAKEEELNPTITLSSTL